MKFVDPTRKAFARTCKTIDRGGPQPTLIGNNEGQPTPIFWDRLRSAFTACSLRGWRSQDRGVRIPLPHQPSLTLANRKRELRLASHALTIANRSVSYGWQATRRLSAVASAKADLHQT